MIIELITNITISDGCTSLIRLVFRRRSLWRRWRVNMAFQMPQQWRGHIAPAYQL